MRRKYLSPYHSLRIPGGGTTGCLCFNKSPAIKHPTNLRSLKVSWILCMRNSENLLPSFSLPLHPQKCRFLLIASYVTKTSSSFVAPRIFFFQMKLGYQYRILFELFSQAEELIKREMVTMIRNDVVNHPTALQIENLTQKKTKNAMQAVLASNRAALESEPLEVFTEKEIANARQLLGGEIEFVKSKMAHGDLPIESYTKVWEECFAQVG